MTLRRQLLLLLLIHLALALATWDGYRLGLRRSRAEWLTPQTKIEIEQPHPLVDQGEWKKDVTYQISSVVKNPDDGLFYIAVEVNKNVKPKFGMQHPWVRITDPHPTVQREQWDANWRLN